MAVGSLILGIFGVNVVAIVLGSIAISQINKSEGSETGKGMAVAGIMLAVLWMIGWIVFWVALMNAASNTSTYY